MTFLDSLKFNREGKEEVFFWFSVSSNMSSLNIALSVFSDTHVSVFTFSSAITSSFLLLLLSVLPGESDHVFYMADKFICSICKVKKLPWVISVSCSLFKELTLCLIYILIPSLSYLLLLVSPFLYPVPSHSCDPLEDIFPSSSQYGFTSALPDNKDLDFLLLYLRIHSHYW